MLRNAWVIFVAIFSTFPLAFATIAVAMVRSTSPMIDRIVRLWARSLVNAAGIDLRTEGMEVVRPDERYVFIANHYSYFDIPCILAAVPQPIRFMAKASLFKIPIFGWAIGRAGFIPIDRKNRRTAVKSFDLAAQRIRAGNTIVIFPEEGRSREIRMRPFQRGAFLLALKTELPIIPIAIDGTYNIFRVGARKVTAGPVTLKFGTRIETKGLSVRAKEQLAVESRRQIHRLLFGRDEELTESPAADS